MLATIALAHCELFVPLVRSLQKQRLCVVEVLPPDASGHEVLGHPHAIILCIGCWERDRAAPGVLALSFSGANPPKHTPLSDMEPAWRSLFEENGFQEPPSVRFRGNTDGMVIIFLRKVPQHAASF